MKPPFAGAHAILRASWTCGQISGNSVDSRVPPYLLEGVEPGLLAGVGLLIFLHLSQPGASPSVPRMERGARPSFA